MKNKKYLIVIIPFFLVLIFFLKESVYMDDVEYSVEESRKLKRIEDINLKSIEELTKDIEDYVVDQFPNRSEILKAYSLKDMYLGKFFTRNLYVSKDNWLFVESQEEDMDKISNSLSKKLLDNSDKKFYYSIIPSKNVALKDKYSFTKNDVSIKNYAKLKENLQVLEEYSNFQVIDLVENLDGEDGLNNEEMWYRSDFHWNGLGGKLGVEYIIDSIYKNEDIDKVYDKNNIYINYPKNKVFKGDLNKRFSDIYLVEEKPVVLDIIDKTGYKYFFSENETSEVARGDIISKGIESDVVNYSELYTPNLAYYRVENENAANDKSILIIKDSMQNTTIDIFTENFTTTRVIDPRLKQKYSFDELAKESDIILLMFHQSNNTEAVGEYLK